MIGLGCMRLSTRPDRDALDAEGVIHAALDAGARLLDTADVYCHNEKDIGHNERLVAKALKSWNGDRSTVEIATKGGMIRPAGKWVADGRAKHLARACEASLLALEVDAIDLYQLHVVDPRTPFETSVRALAALHTAGLIRKIGLSNVTVGQIQVARDIAAIDAVQVSMSVLDDVSLRNGVAEYCRDEGIRLIAYRPLGGASGIGRVARDSVLAGIAARHGATPQETALAWLLDLGPAVVPIPGATRVETARSLGQAAAIRLTEDDRQQLDRQFPAGRLLRVPRHARRPAAGAPGEVVLVMGMPGAGKSEVQREFEAQGFARLNRDSRGGTLGELVPELARGLLQGRRHWVLDNTYASRAARNEVIECAWAAGVPVRCIWLRTSIADAQINAITRLIEAHGRLPSPEELRERGRKDSRYFGPDAQFRYERALEPPVVEEGFTAVEERSFVRRESAGHRGRAVVLELDGVLCDSASGAPSVLERDDLMIPPRRRDVLQRYHAEGWKLFAHAWRPQVARGELSAEAVTRTFERMGEILGLDIDAGYCPHDAGPPVCWCRKPLPGLLLEFSLRHGVRLEDSIMVGLGAADRTMAQRLRMTLLEPAEFFA
jgi:aryl-alcohol dehydrogenase-like predicted oxidoreductase/histidinol phosphatase-like enzyme